MDSWCRTIFLLAGLSLLMGKNFARMGLLKEQQGFKYLLYFGMSETPLKNWNGNAVQGTDGWGSHIIHKEMKGLETWLK